MLTNAEINAKWKRAEKLAEIIVFAWVYDNNKEEARQAQRELAQWLDVVRQENIVYNGCYDQYISMKI